MSRWFSRGSRVTDQYLPRSVCDRWNHQRPPTRHKTPAPNGQGRSEYSATEKTGDDPDQWNDESHPRESQQGDFARTFATPRDLDSATPAPVRCSNHDHHDTGGENHRLGDPRVHDRSAAVAGRPSRTSTAAGVRLAPHLEVDKAMCADQEVQKSVETNGVILTRVRPIASTAANVRARRLSPSPSRTDDASSPHSSSSAVYARSRPGPRRPLAKRHDQESYSRSYGCRLMAGAAFRWQSVASRLCSVCSGAIRSSTAFSKMHGQALPTVNLLVLEPGGSWS
jgi:hypothetical protein